MSGIYWLARISNNACEKTQDRRFKDAVKSKQTDANLDKAEIFIKSNIKLCQLTTKYIYIFTWPAFFRRKLIHRTKSNQESITRLKALQLHGYW